MRVFFYHSKLSLILLVVDGKGGWVDEGKVRLIKIVLLLLVRAYIEVRLMGWIIKTEDNIV